MTALSYLLTASLYLVLFYGCYWLLLRRNTFFGLNRAYLLASVVLSLGLPLVRLPNGTAESLPVGTITLSTFVVGGHAPAPSDALLMNHWLWLLYLGGAGVMLARLGLQLWAIFRLINSGRRERYRLYTLVELSDDRTPSFSFGRYLVLNQSDALTRPDALLRHEEIHIRQRHTLDILFVEMLRAAFWFNPVLWLYKRSLQEVHEYLADRAVAQSVSRPDYARQLVAYALNVPSAALTTPFVSVSTLKQRIVMLQKTQSKRRALLGYALVLPLASLLTLCTQPDREPLQTASERTSSEASARIAASVEGEIFTVVENQPEFTGGIEKLYQFLGANIRYPEAAQKANVQGRVFLQFVVTKEGDVANVKVLKGIGYGADEEAVRVLKAMPRWQPGTQNGRAVNVQYNLPINFQLDGPDEESIRAVGPPPPPPVPANDASVLNDVKRFMINGKEASKAEVSALSPNTIRRVDVDKKQRLIAITTK
ncbi:M56 family metallopeptidase [Spirosoma taeanense]|uniref:M56 family metallopeptidase n=1 Tax=Spirosoma taeanense TaxID=2735870 RepID=A0A6M5Y6U1_9BACT|nr:M56 family metallopeptidase [Spirosoma taeanense]QJW88422.1 M56 family metallopeptidase [Spirosoma taeanense]